jgi:Domain of unknown function (DUF4170)
MPHARRQQASPETDDMSKTEQPQETSERTPKQLLHLVFGGELTSLDAIDFVDVSKLDIVGIYPNYAEAHRAWKAVAQRTVDNAHMRYFIVHMHRLLDPNASSGKG